MLRPKRGADVPKVSPRDTLSCDRDPKRPFKAGSFVSARWEARCPLRPGCAGATKRSNPGVGTPYERVVCLY